MPLSLCLCASSAHVALGGAALAVASRRFAQSFGVRLDDPALRALLGRAETILRESPVRAAASYCDAVGAQRLSPACLVRGPPKQGVISCRRGLSLSPFLLLQC